LNEYIFGTRHISVDLLGLVWEARKIKFSHPLTLKRQQRQCLCQTYTFAFSLHRFFDSFFLVCLCISLFLKSQTANGTSRQTCAPGGGHAAQGPSEIRSSSPTHFFLFPLSFFFCLHLLLSLCCRSFFFIHYNHSVVHHRNFHRICPRNLPRQSRHIRC